MNNDRKKESLSEKETENIAKGRRSKDLDGLIECPDCGCTKIDSYVSEDGKKILFRCRKCRKVFEAK